MVIKEYLITFYCDSNVIVNTAIDGDSQDSITNILMKKIKYAKRKKGALSITDPNGNVVSIFPERLCAIKVIKNES